MAPTFLTGSQKLCPNRTKSQVFCRYVQYTCSLLVYLYTLVNGRYCFDTCRICTHKYVGTAWTHRHIGRYYMYTQLGITCTHCQVLHVHTVRYYLYIQVGTTFTHNLVLLVHTARYYLYTQQGTTCTHSQAMFVHTVGRYSLYTISYFLYKLIKICKKNVLQG